MIEEYVERAMRLPLGRSIGEDKVRFILKHRNERKADIAMICNISAWIVWKILRKTGVPFERSQGRIMRYADKVGRLYPLYSSAEVAGKLGISARQVKYLVRRCGYHKSEAGRERLRRQRIHNLNISPEKRAQGIETRRKLLEEDRKRFLEGKPQKTKMKFPKVDMRERKWQRRYMLMWRYGYTADDEHPHVLYYTATTRRSTREYLYERRYGFKFYEKR